jgi:class 3 adenylate cyclase/tetratricopeptide (TPR) repeat protein
MQCSRCLTENPDGARFCGTCGAHLEAPCSGCGAWNPPGNRFCHACGAALASTESVSNRSTADERSTLTRSQEGPAIEAERKLVTVLFADLKGSLELIAERDPEDARELLDTVTQCMVDAVRHFGGTVTHVMGDGIMALFGAPVAQEDHAFRACNAALRMQDTVARVSQQLQQRFGVSPVLRVGLNSGEVVVRSFPSDLHDDYSAIGPTTHLAARMEQISEPGKVLITEETWRLVRSFVRTVALGEVTVKGLGRPTHVFQLVGVTGTRLRFEAARARGLTPFVGRQPELARLRHVLTSAPRGQVVALVGDPGVGKSRLVWELTNTLGSAGWLVLFGSAQAYAQASPYVVFSELLRHYFDLANGLDSEALASAVATRLHAIDPQLAEYSPAILTLLDPGPVDAPFSRLPPESRKQMIREAVARVLLRESHRQPVLLVVEDLQWLDPESQAVLNTLVDRLPAGRVSLLAVYRPEFHHEWGALSYYTQLRIDPLPNQPARKLLQALVGQDPALDSVIDLLLAQAEGNPFFLEERVWSLVEQGALAGVRGAYRVTGPIESLDQVPATVHALVASRIDRLPRDAKVLLQTAAVIGRDVPQPLLRAVTAWPDSRLEPALAHLEAAEFIYPSELSPEVAYSFRHALTHEVSYGSLLQRRRRELHADVLSALERGEGGRLGEQVERMAEHAVRGEVWPKAVHYLRRSGARAFAQSAHGLAARWFESGLDALKRLPPSRDRTEQTVDLYLDLRYALSPLGEFRRILECLGEAEKLAHELGDQRRLGLITSYLSNHFQVVGELGRAIEYGERALETAAREGDLGTQVVARSYLSLAYQTLGDYERAITLARQNLEILGRAREREWFGMALLPAVYSRTALVRALAETGEFEEALSVADQAVDLSQQVQHPYSLMFALLGLGVVQLRRGLAETALSPLQQSFQLCRDARSPTMTALVGAFLASAHAGTGDRAAATQVLDEADGQAAAIGLTESTLPRALGLSARSEIYQQAGDFDEAVKSAEASREAFRRMGARGYEAWALLMIAASRARAERADPPGAVERGFREALAQAEALGMRPLIARCHLGVGEFLDQQGRHEEAQWSLTRARDELESLGITAGTAPSGRDRRS